MNPRPLDPQDGGLGVSADQAGHMGERLVCRHADCPAQCMACGLHVVPRSAVRSTWLTGCLEDAAHISEAVAHLAGGVAVRQLKGVKLTSAAGVCADAA